MSSLLFYLIHRLKRSREISIRTTRMNLMIFIIITDFPKNWERQKEDKADQVQVRVTELPSTIFGPSGGDASKWINYKMRKVALVQHVVLELLSELQQQTECEADRAEESRHDQKCLTSPSVVCFFLNNQFHSHFTSIKMYSDVFFPSSFSAVQ